MLQNKYIPSVNIASFEDAFPQAQSRRSDFTGTESSHYNGIALQGKIPVSFGHSIVDNKCAESAFFKKKSFPKKEIQIHVDQEFVLIIHNNGKSLVKSIFYSRLASIPKLTPGAANLIVVFVKFLNKRAHFP